MKARIVIGAIVLCVTIWLPPLPGQDVLPEVPLKTKLEFERLKSQYWQLQTQLREITAAIDKINKALEAKVHDMQTVCSSGQTELDQIETDPICVATKRKDSNSKRNPPQ